MSSKAPILLVGLLVACGSDAPADEPAGDPPANTREPSVGAPSGETPSTGVPADEEPEPIVEARPEVRYYLIADT